MLGLDKAAQQVSHKMDQPDVYEGVPQHKSNDQAGGVNGGQVKKWMDSLRAKNFRRSPNVNVEGWPDDESMSNFSLLNLDTSCGKSKQWDALSSNSSAVLGTPETASLSIISQSCASRSRGNTQSTHRSSSFKEHSELSEIRDSLDSIRLTTTISIENTVRSRAAKRRHVLHEIYLSETNYVLGLKTLSDILATLPATRPTIQTSLQNIRSIHEAFLEKLREVTPSSLENPSTEVPHLYGLQEKIRGFSHSRNRNRSLRTRHLVSILNTRMSKTVAETSEVLKVVQELNTLCDHLGVYEDYGNKYELLTRDVEIIRRSIPAGGFWISGVEALSASVASDSIRKLEKNRSMTIDDLLVKPFQRICKYPLLLQELMKHTPPSECPSTHEATKQTWNKMQSVVQRVNCATDNILLKDRIRKTITLHEKLDYGNQTILSNVYQQLGFMNLCGVLHVAYKTPSRVFGEYMVCTLFSSYLVLTRRCNESRKLRIFAAIYVPEMKVDPLANGRGLACCDCPYSWKIIFLGDDQPFELIVSAASANEEKRWKTELLRFSVLPLTMLPTMSLEPKIFSYYPVEMTPFEENTAAAGLTRKSSIRSLSTRMSAKPQSDQVIIKRTYSSLHDGEPVQSPEIELKRSRSVATLTRTTVLSPFRQDRVKLERTIADIYTRDALPYPGMILTRADYLRSQTLMRGLSFRSPFGSRRSTSGGRRSLSSGGSTRELRNNENILDKVSEDGYLLRELFRIKDDGNETRDSRSNSGESMRAVLNIRRRVMRTSSETTDSNITEKTTATKRQTIWKRWTSSIPLFGRQSSLRNNAMHG